MSHNIWQDGQVDHMFCVGNKAAAWHELGQRTDTAVNWQQAMELAGLNWEVVKKQLYARTPAMADYPNGKVVPVEAWGIFRDCDAAFLGAVGAQYTPVQNKYAFEFVDTLLEASGAHYESAGALGKGERIWCLARVPGDITIRGTADSSQVYLLFETSHDGSRSATCRLSTVRVVCQNTLNMALSHTNGSFVRVKHTKQVEARMDAARKLMFGVQQDVKSLEEKLNLLALRRLTRESYTGILDRLFPLTEEQLSGKASRTKRDNTVTDITALFEKNDNNAIPEVRGTAYNLLNAVTEYTDHHRTARITDGREGYTLNRARAENALFGTGDNLKTQALEMILQSTEGAPIRATKIQTTAPGILDDVLAQSASN